MQTQLPQHGQIIVFTKVPTASYCHTDEAYRVVRGTVTRKGKKFPSDYIKFERVDGGSSTIDRAWAVARSEWRVA